MWLFILCYDIEMKMYITSRFKGAENKNEIEELCEAVKTAGIQDFSFVRDIENYQKTFDDPKELWNRSLEEIKKCDALLIDVSDSPTGGRVIETGIAYALGKPVVTICKNDTTYKDLYNGLSDLVIRFDSYPEITLILKNWLKDRQ